VVRLSDAGADVLGNYDLPGASAIYQKLMGFLASQ
jgi:hypothetical protein